MEKGMPYQLMVSNIIHEYLTGRLIEQREQGRMLKFVHFGNHGRYFGQPNFKL